MNRLLSVAMLLTLAAAAPAASLRPVLVNAHGLSAPAAKPAPPLTLPFGTSRTRTLAALGFLGLGKASSNSDCDGGALSWVVYPRGLTVYFEGGRFAGWWANAGSNGVATAKGIRPGSSRAELAKAYKIKAFESSLGEEFEAGGLFGLFDGKQRVESLYSGRVCTAR
ncbi:MAG: hypothetical protein ABIQ32_10670 [Sphingomicrobium sp.]